jgi:poly-gamma-glutamate synthesis protein (capsule biosynthesis protein)
MDYGAGGLLATIRALKSAGLVFAGAGENLALARAPAYTETAGGRVALISVASTLSDEDRAGPQRSDIRGRPGLNPLRYSTTYVVSNESMEKLKQVGEELGYSAPERSDRLRFLRTTFEVGDEVGRRSAPHAGDLADIVAAVQEARRQADWVIVASHSHESGSSREVPADFLVTFAHAVIDAGADIWVGHGPHVLRGIEIYNGKPIFHSLSNFLFQNETVRFLPGDFYEQEGLPANANAADAFDARNEHSSYGGFPGRADFWESVIAEPEFVDGTLTEIRLHPIELGFGKPRPQRGRPLPADREAGRRIIEKLAELSQPFGTSVRYDSDRNVGVVAGLRRR